MTRNEYIKAREADDLDVYQWEREVLEDAISTCKAFIEEWRDKENSL